MDVTSLRRKLYLQVLLCGVLGFLIPVLRCVIQGLPAPSMHDEYSYLLAADTFAQGRLSNPSPGLPLFFDAPHVLVEPTYQSKYPPGGPLIMAFGQVVFGHPAWGIWISCGLFSAAICWMMQTFGLMRWAMLMAVLFSCVLIPKSRMGYGYMPSMLTGAAAAVFFGGLNQTLRRPIWWSTTLLSLGVVGLSVTRPYEGALLCLGCLPAFLIWILRDTRVSLAVKINNVVIPGAILIGASAVCLGTYNEAVTGSPLKLPYSLHHQQYFHRGLFVFQGNQKPTRAVCPRIDSVYQQLSKGPVSQDDFRLLKNGVKRSYTSLQSVLGMQGWPATFLAVLVLLGFMDRRLRRYVPALGLWFAGQSIATWHMPWYAMPVVPLVYVALVSVIQKPLRRWRCRPLEWSNRLPAWTPWMAAVAVLVAMIWFGPAMARESSAILRKKPSIDFWKNSDNGIPDVSVASRLGLMQYLESQTGRDLVFVSYASDYSVHDEWVYNRADLPNSEVILAHDLGDEQNQKLIAEYSHRTVWKLHLERSSKTLTPWRRGEPVK